MRRLTDGVLSHLDDVLSEAGSDAAHEPEDAIDEPFSDAMTRHTMSTPLAVVAGRFQVHGVLGRGGMSEVYRAQDLTTGHELALKVQNAGEAWLDARFDREARTLQELSHPSLVTYVAHGRTEDNLLWLATEIVAGPTLAEDLEMRARRRVPHTWEQVAQVARDVGGALGALHERGLVHRDVKPSNIVMATQGPIRLLDLGLLNAGPEIAAHGAGLTQSGALLGTVGYLSPEQARRDRGIGPQADVFALGCVVFECIAGAPPFGKSLTEVTAAFAMGCHVPLERLPADVPDALRTFVLEALAEDPNARPSDGREVAARFATFSSASSPGTLANERGGAADIDDLMSSTIGIDASARRAPALPFVTGRRVDPPAVAPVSPGTTGTLSMVVVDPDRLVGPASAQLALDLLWFDSEAWHPTADTALEALRGARVCVTREAVSSYREAVERGSRSVVVVAGILELTFDAVESLRATLGAVTPFLQMDERMKDAFDAAVLALSTPGDTKERIAASHKQRLDELLARISPNRGAIDSQVERALIESRGFCRRTVFGGPHLKASLEGVTTYVPERAASELPLMRSIGVRAAVEVRPPQELDDPNTVSYRVRAIARTI